MSQVPTETAAATVNGAATGGPPYRVAILHQHRAPDDDAVAALLESFLAHAGHHVFVDRTVEGNMDWAKRLQAAIEEADVVVPLLSVESMIDEVLSFECEVAQEAARRRRGRPVSVPIRIRCLCPLPPQLRAMLPPEYLLWEGEESNLGLTTELEAMLQRLPDWQPPRPHPANAGGPGESSEGSVQGAKRRKLPLEPIGGAVPLDSPFYVMRPADAELHQAVERLDSIVLIKGARQMGKTSLLARGLQAARGKAKVALTDFQEFGTANLENTTTLYQSLSESLVDRLGLHVDPAAHWDARRSANVNFDRFMRREVLAKIGGPLVWGLDEVDRLLVTNYASEVFGLFRSWHNQRALDPSGPWGSLSMLIAYATEAYLFISDPNQSPFNVGTRLALDDFTPEQVAELNERYGSPLRSEADLKQFCRLVAGHPYLVRRGLHEIATRKMDPEVFEAKAASEEGVFADHLRRILMLMARDTELLEAVRDNLQGGMACGPEAFHRLRTAGVMSGTAPSDMRPRCHLYAIYLRQHLL